MGEIERRDGLGLRACRDEIRALTADTVARWVERRRGVPGTWVRVLVGFIFFVCSVTFFLSMLSWRGVGRSNFDSGLQKLNNVESNNDIQI